MQQINGILQGMIMMNVIPVFERLITNDINVCIYIGILYLIFTHYSNIIQYYYSKMNKDKIGRIYSISIYKSRQTCKSSGSKEIKAILYDFFNNKELYNINQFETISCAGTKANDEWYTLHSVDYDNNFHIPTQHYFTIIFKQIDEKNPIKIHIKKTTDYSTDNDNKKQNFDEKITHRFDIYMYKGNIDDYIDYCNEEYEKYEYKKKNKYPLIESRPSDSDNDALITKFHSNKRFDDIAHNIFIDENIINEIKSCISNVLNEKCFFIEKGLTRKFVALLHGPSGTGKSSIIKAAMNYCQQFGKVRHIKRIDLSNFKNKDDLNEEFINSDAKIIYLEEVDRAQCIHIKQKDDCLSNIFSMEECTKLSKTELLEKMETFGKNSISNIHSIQSNIKIEEILELFDGLPELDGYIILMTTNNIDNIEPRFRRRCQEFYIGNQSEDLLKKQLEFYYDEDNYFSDKNISFKSNVWSGCDVEKKFLRNPTYPTIQDAIKYIKDNE